MDVTWFCHLVYLVFGHLVFVVTWFLSPGFLEKGLKLNKTVTGRNSR
jgi:hypothetical protein